MDRISAADLLFSSTMPGAAQFDGMAVGALGRGIDRYRAGDYPSAIREFRWTIALSPYSNNALKAFEYLANTYLKTDRTADAIRTLRQAINVFPSADGMRLNLGNILYSEGRYSEAVDQYKAAARINPTLSQNVYSLGQGYLAQDRYADAEIQFKRAIQLSPKDAGGYYALGQTYHRMGRIEDAKDQLNRALAIKPNYTDVHFELGMIYTSQGQTDEAKATLIILKDRGATLLYAELLARINETSRPGFRAVYSPYLNLSAGPHTRVSSLDSSLAPAGAAKQYSVTFVFDKQMDAASVGNVFNWNISRSVSARTGGLYNYGVTRSPNTDVSVHMWPARVTYDPKSLTAQVTFSIGQNAAGNGTIDLSHLVFKFKGTDTYGNAMNPAADEYNRISRIV